MEAIILQAFENIRCTFLNFIFCLSTFMGQEIIVVLVVAILYWAVNKRIGEYLMVTLLTSISVNGIIKDSVKRRRPYIVGDCSRVEVDNFFVSTMTLDSSYSFPSGHSQLAGSFYCGISLSFKKKWIYAVSSAIIFLVMLSRLYLGVHYPTDVICGAALGIGVASLINFIYVKHYEKRSALFLIIALLLSISLFFVKSPDSFKALGALTGLSLGLFIENKYIKFTNSKILWKSILRIILGVAILLVVKEVLKLIFPAKLFFEYLRYFLVIFSAIGLYPMLFKKLKF